MMRYKRWRYRRTKILLSRVPVFIALAVLIMALALPQYRHYRARSSDRLAYQALKLVAAAEEAYFVNTASYLTCDQDDCSYLLPQLRRLPAGLNLRVEAFEDTFAARASHASGTGRVFMWAGTSAAEDGREQT